MNKRYVITVTLMTFILPVTGTIIDHYASGQTISFALFAKWFIFFAVGLRLLTAGIMQAVKPAFTAQEIFHIQTTDVFPIVRELGFANICFGVTAMISLCKPEWRVVSAFASGLYYGFAGLLHVIKRPVGFNEAFALWTDLFIFGVLLAYLLF